MKCFSCAKNFVSSVQRDNPASFMGLSFLMLLLALKSLIKMLLKNGLMVLLNDIWLALIDGSLYVLIIYSALFQQEISTFGSNTTIVTKNLYNLHSSPQISVTDMIIALHGPIVSCYGRYNICGSFLSCIIGSWH